MNQAHAIGGTFHGQLVENVGDEFTAETGEKYIRHEVRSICGVVVTLFLLDGMHECVIWDNVQFTLTVTKHFCMPFMIPQKLQVNFDSISSD